MEGRGTRKTEGERREEEGNIIVYALNFSSSSRLARNQVLFGRCSVH